ncbi:SigE family RNA polymerase sigma factor [Nocardioides silvaticus]|uniref:SigE family RNA polymerase sigma factor n=1 Tax=Nocardioides silvaticus TaxID=2201891 RepID=A0A316TEB3_9ACTN|nr:SigE family RNA polymerase sigma factor [Nocardioides silvaticus]PWN01585.1 SigE family RNA polymerase sigma factor [Nocardioides silvaticus]
MDDAEYDAYVLARWPALVRSAVGLGCDPEEARDLAQTTLLRCYVAWRKVQRARDRDAYVYRILLNCYRDSHRRQWWSEAPTADLPDAPDRRDAIVDADLADAVRRALADLDQDQRAVVVLRYFAHLSEAQTATVLGIAPGTVKSRLSRALVKLAVHPQLPDPVEGA